tara:strand:+ start:772 stop:1605 length:834 start_codon:yes stop_codon:yes gene_type:complete
MEISLIQDEKLLIEGIEMPVNKVVHATWIDDIQYQETLIELVESKIKGVEEGLKSGRYNFAKLQISHHTNDLGEPMQTNRSDTIGYALMDNNYIKSLNLGQKEVLSLTSIENFNGVVWHNIQDNKVYETGLKDLVEKVISYFTFDFANIQRKLGPFERGSIEVEGKKYEYDTIIALRPNTTDHFNLTKEDWKPLMGLKFGRYQSYLTETFAICAEEDIKVSNQAYEIIDISELYESDGVPKKTEDILHYFGTSLKNVVPMLKRTIARRLERLKKAKS